MGWGQWGWQLAVSLPEWGAACALLAAHPFLTLLWLWRSLRCKARSWRGEAVGAAVGRAPRFAGCLAAPAPSIARRARTAGSGDGSVLHTPGGDAERQRRLGPQSLRGGRAGLPALPLAPGQFGNTRHGIDVYEVMIENERRLCGEYCVFYHGYSSPDLLYETNAALAVAVHGHPLGTPPLPRGVRGEVHTAPFMSFREPLTVSDARELAALTGPGQYEGLRSGDPAFRDCAICASVSLHQIDCWPRCGTPGTTFEVGYPGPSRIPYPWLLQTALSDAGVPEPDSTARQLREIWERGGRCAACYASKPPKAKTSHTLQIFVRRDRVDDLVYAADYTGLLDKSRMPLSQHLAGGGSPTGVACVLVDPLAFLDPSVVRVFPFSASRAAMATRRDMHEQLVACLRDRLS